MILTRRGKRRLLFLLAGVILCGGASAALVGLRHLQRERALLESRSDGLAAYDDGDYQTALERLSRVISHNPADLEVILACAQSRARVPEVNDAHLPQVVSLFRSALRLDAENRQALDGLLAIYGQLNYRTEMGEIADRILRLDDGDIAALAAKVRVARVEGESEEVLRLAGRLAELEPSELAWRRLTLVTKKSQGVDVAELLATCDGWIAEHEGDGRFALLKAELLTEYGRELDAQEALASAAALGADSREVLDRLLTLMDDLGLRAETAELLDDTRSRHPNESWVFEAAARHHWQALRYDEALAELAQGEAQTGGATPGLLTWRAIVLSSLGDHDAASDVIAQMQWLAEDATRDEVDAAIAWREVVIAERRLAEGDWVTACDAYERAAALLPDDPVVQYLHANAYQQQGEHEIAMSVLVRLARQERGWLAVRVSLANSLLATGRPGEAFRAMRDAITDRPTMHAGAYLALCEAWLQIDPTSASVTLVESHGQIQLTLLTVLEQLHRRLGWHAQTTRMLAEVYLHEGQNEALTTLVGRAMSENDVPVETLLALATVSGRWGLDAEDQLVAAAETRDPSAPEVIAARARLLQDRGRLDEAIAHINAARQQAPAGSREAETLEWAALRLRIQGGDPDARQEAIELLGRSTRPDQPFSLLALDELWDDPALTRAIIDHLKETFGERSLRLRLAEAQYAYRCERDDPAAIAVALTMVDYVLRLAPRTKAALMLRAQLQLADDPPQTDAAIQTFQTAVQTYPDELSLYEPLVRLLQRQGDFATADRYLLQLAEHTGSRGELSRTVVELLARQSDFDHAARRLATFVDGEAPEADQLWLASLHARAGQHAEAEAILASLLARTPPSGDAVLAMARFRAADGRLDEAVTIIETHLDAPNEAIRERAIGLVLVGVGERDAAETHLTRAAELDPDDIASWAALANLHLARGELDRAGEAIRRGLAIDPDDAQLNAMMAMTEAARGGADQTRIAAMLDDIGSATTVAKEIARLLGRMNAPTQQDLDDARAVAQDHPGLLSAWRLAIDLHVAAGRTDEAIELARQAVGRMPAHPAPAEIATRLMIRAGRSDDALSMANTWRRRSLAAPIAADTVIAALLIDRGRAQAALDQLAPYGDRLWNERARFPDRVEIWLTALLATGQGPETLTRVDTLIAEDRAWVARALNITRSVDAPAARALLTGLETHVSDEPRDRLRLALAWNELAGRTGEDGDFQKAEALATAAAQEADLASSATLVRAGIAADRGDLTLSETLYRTVLAEAPDNVIVLNNLASVLVRRGAACDEAVTLAERAVALSGDEPSVVDTLALAHLCAGNLAEAEARIRSVLDAGHAHPGFNLTLARIYSASDRRPEAREELRRARNAVRAMAKPDPKLQREVDEVERLLGGEPAAAAPPAR